MNDTTTTESIHLANEIIILGLEKKLSEALSAYVEASLVAEKAACRWEEIQDSLRSQGCNI
jgi:hypothetical protein